MDYEKKYKEALERATKAKNNASLSKGTLRVLGIIFPELKESEDERIRKAQLDYWRSVGGKEWHGVPVQETIAWLEKQCKQDDYDDNIITRDDEILQAISVGLTDVAKDAGWSDFGGIPIEDIMDWLEKQGEQKPKWTEADEAHLHSVTTHLEQWIERHPNTCGADIQGENLAWLKTLKHRLQ